MNQANSVSNVISTGGYVVSGKGVLGCIESGARILQTTNSQLIPGLKKAISKLGGTTRVNNTISTATSPVKSKINILA